VVLISSKTSFCRAVSGRIKDLSVHTVPVIIYT